MCAVCGANVNGVRRMPTHVSPQSPEAALSELNLDIKINLSEFDDVAMSEAVDPQQQISQAMDLSPAKPDQQSSVTPQSSFNVTDQGKPPLVQFSALDLYGM